MQFNTHILHKIPSLTQEKIPEEQVYQDQEGHQNVEIDLTFLTHSSHLSCQRQRPTSCMGS